MKKQIYKTTFNNGYLGSRNDEERSEMRYVMWIAELSESSNLWTHIALLSILESIFIWVSFITSHKPYILFYGEYKMFMVNDYLKEILRYYF